MPLPEAILTQFTDIYSALGEDEFKNKITLAVFGRIKLQEMFLQGNFLGVICIEFFGIFLQELCMCRIALKDINMYIVFVSFIICRNLKEKCLLNFSTMENYDL